MHTMLINGTERQPAPALRARFHTQKSPRDIVKRKPTADMVRRERAHHPNAQAHRNASPWPQEEVFARLQEKQRELEKLEVIFKENKQSELERKMAVKYHKVKFFERVKITRAIEKLEKANPVEAKRTDAVTKNIESLRDDLHYVTNFPKGYKYVSVLKGDADDDAIRRKREKLRQIIKERGLADAALAEANEGGTDAAAAVVKAAGEKEKEKDDFFMESDSDSGSDSD